MGVGNNNAAAKAALKEITAATLRTVYEDKRLVVYSFLMVAVGLAIAEGMNFVYSYDGGAYLEALIASVGAGTLVGMHRFAFFILFWFITQILVAFSSTYLNLAMLVDIKSHRQGRGGFYASIRSAAKYAPTIAIWVVILYPIITFYSVYEAYSAGLSISVAFVYIPASIPITYVLLQVFEDNEGPIALVKDAFGKLAHVLRMLGNRGSMPYILLLLAVFVIFNAFQFVVNLALGNSWTPGDFLTDTVLVIVSLVLINVFGLTTYEYFRDRLA